MWHLRCSHRSRSHGSSHRAATRTPSDDTAPTHPPTSTAFNTAQPALRQSGRRCGPHARRRERGKRLKAVRFANPVHRCVMIHSVELKSVPPLTVVVFTAYPGKPKTLGKRNASRIAGVDLHVQRLESVVFSPTDGGKHKERCRRPMRTWRALALRLIDGQLCGRFRQRFLRLVGVPRSPDGPIEARIDLSDVVGSSRFIKILRQTSKILSSIPARVRKPGFELVSKLPQTRPPNLNRPQYITFSAPRDEGRFAVIERDRLQSRLRQDLFCRALLPPQPKLAG